MQGKKNHLAQSLSFAHQSLKTLISALDVKQGFPYSLHFLFETFTSIVSIKVCEMEKAKRFISAPTYCFEKKLATYK
jgi:hypothetical protein